jgi:hypothetical protein
MGSRHRLRDVQEFGGYIEGWWAIIRAVVSCEVWRCGIQWLFGRYAPIRITEYCPWL